MRFLRALILAYDALQKNHSVAIRAVAEETGTKTEWVEQIYRDAPRPEYTLVGRPSVSLSRWLRGRSFTGD